MSENHPKQRPGNDLIKHPQLLPHPSKQGENPVILKAPKHWSGGGPYTENSQLQQISNSSKCYSALNMASDQQSIRQ